MRGPMLFKTLMYDARAIGGKTEVTFFNERDEDDESVTSYSESDIVKWLFTRFNFRDMFLQDFFNSPKDLEMYFEVAEPVTNKNSKPGDIDLLVVNKSRPDLSIAFECKKVKVVFTEEGYSKMNNAEKIRKAIDQVNEYYKLGFHKNYLMIILLDDGRERENPGVMFRMSNMEIKERIYDIPYQGGLNENVGVIYVQISQPTGASINLMGSLGFRIDKQATPRNQRIELTNRIKEIIS